MSVIISVITPTKDRRDLLARCIASIAAQDYPLKEHVVVDGASDDGTVELLREQAAHMPHLTWISEPDDNLAQAMNKGLALATGDVLGVVGDDDVLEPGALAAIALEFDAAADLAVVSASAELVDASGAPIQRQRARFTNRAELVECWRYWGQRVMLPAPATFFHRRVLETVGGFDERDRYAMDYDHWLRITERYPVKTLDVVLARHRFAPGTISFSENERQLAEMRRISRRYWGSKRRGTYWAFATSYVRWAAFPRLRKPIRAFRRAVASRA